MKNYFSKIAKYVSAAAIGAGLIFLPVKNAAMQSSSQSKSVLEQILDYKQKPGNLWAEVLGERKEPPKKQRSILKIVNSKNNYSQNQVLSYFGKNLGLKYGNALKPSDRILNEQIIKNLHDEEFDYLVGKIGFDNVRKLAFTEEDCFYYPLGKARMEKLGGLVKVINEAVRGKDTSAMQILTHVSVEGGGENILNCEGGGGALHILYENIRGNNILNLGKNVEKGVEMLESLARKFGNPQTASVAFNTSGRKLLYAMNDMKNYFKAHGIKRNPTHLEIMAMLKINDPIAHKRAARYEALYRGHGEFLTCHFEMYKSPADLERGERARDLRNLARKFRNQMAAAKGDFEQYYLKPHGLKREATHEETMAMMKISNPIEYNLARIYRVFYKQYIGTVERKGIIPVERTHFEHDKKENKLRHIQVPNIKNFMPNLGV